MNSATAPAGPIFAAIYREHLRLAIIDKFGDRPYLCLKHLWNHGYRGAQLRLPVQGVPFVP